MHGIFECFHGPWKAPLLFHSCTAIILKEKIFIFNLKTPYYISRSASRRPESTREKLRTVRAGNHFRLQLSRGTRPYLNPTQSIDSSKEFGGILTWQTSWRIVDFEVVVSEGNEVNQLRM